MRPAIVFDDVVPTAQTKQYHVVTAGSMGKMAVSSIAGSLWLVPKCCDVVLQW